MNTYDHTYYLNDTLRIENYKQYMAKAIRILMARRSEFDAIAFTGLSGALAAIPLAHALDIPMIAVRKSREVNHSGRGVEGCSSAKRYVIIDECIASGSTVARIQRAIWQFSQAECIGILLFNLLKLSDYNDLTPTEPWQLDKDMRYNDFGENEKPKQPQSLPSLTKYVRWENVRFDPEPCRLPEVYFTTQEEIDSVETKQQEAEKVRQEVLRQATSLNQSVQQSRLRQSAERPRAQANAVAERIKRESARRVQEKTRQFLVQKYGGYGSWNAPR